MYPAPLLHIHPTEQISEGQYNSCKLETFVQSLLFDWKHLKIKYGQGNQGQWTFPSTSCMPGLCYVPLMCYFSTSC